MLNQNGIIQTYAIIVFQRKTRQYALHDLLEKTKRVFMILKFALLLHIIIVIDPISRWWLGTGMYALVAWQHKIDNWFIISIVLSINTKSNPIIPYDLMKKET